MSYYNILSIDPFSSMEQVNEAYNKIIDKLQDKEAQNEIDKAYHTLSNYNSRRMYDNQSENSNIVKDVIASNEEEGNKFFLNNEHNEHSQIQNFNNNSFLSTNDNFQDKFDSQIVNINQRLEQIEKKIECSNKTNFYREKKYIKEQVKNNKKIITIDYYINDNGYKKKSTKVIEYSENGEKKIYYK